MKLTSQWDRLLFAVWLAVVAVFASYAVQLATPCQTEDSTGCYWNAETSGNGQGTSFIAVTDTLSLTTK